MFESGTTGPTTDRTAVYIRRSTSEQEDQHQRDDIEAWLQGRDLLFDDVDIYVDTASGARADREDFVRLMDDIEAGAYDDLVVWELSRLAREPDIAERFFALCEDEGVDIHITDGLLPHIPADYGMMRAIASFGVHMAKQERERLISRTKSGLRRARNEGKWIGQVPAGFVRADGYLTPNLDPDYEAGETGFFDVTTALERLDDGESYRAVAADTPNLSRPGLMNIDKDDARRRWYLEFEADEDSVARALADLDPQ